MQDYIQSGLIVINVLVTIWLALRQHKISKTNLKINLFEKRYTIYESTYNFISDFLITYELEKMSDLIINFKKNVHQSIFLFDDKVEEYLLKVLASAEKIYSLKSNQEYISDKDYCKEIEWFEKQKTEARVCFKKDMKIKF